MSEEAFEAAAKEATTILPDTTTNEEKLELYALFKQAKFGDNTTAKPNIFDPKGRAKWDAWEKKKGLSQEEARAQYVSYVEQLKQKYVPQAAAATS